MNGFEAEVRERRVGFMYAGLPGAGKTTVAELAAELTNGGFYNTGDVIREAAADDGLVDPSSEELSEWAAHGRRMYGDGFVPQRMVAQFRNGGVEPRFPMHVDGIRNTAGVAEFRDYFSSSFLVLVKAPFDVRLERLKERDRDGEGSFEKIDLLERDQRELNELGTAEILESPAVDVVLENDYDNLGPIRGDVQQIVNDFVQFNNHA